MATTEAYIEIPGTFVAVVDEAGKVTKFIFSPLESYAGYFGTGSMNVETGEVVDPDPEGPFWTAVSAVLTTDGATVPVMWES